MSVSKMQHRACPQYKPQRESLGLPIADAEIHADVHFLFKAQTFEALCGSPLYYLQEIRRQGYVSSSRYATEYSRCEAEFAALLSASVEPFQFDATVCVPTERPFLQYAYREAILRINLDAADYTSHIRRIDRNLIGGTLHERVSNLQLDIESLPTDLRLVVVDDVFTTGLSAAAVMKRFQLSETGGGCSFRLAVPLWIRQDLGDPMRRLLNLTKEMPNDSM